MTDLFLKILNMSISASWLILAVLLLRFGLKKAPKWVMVLLWGIVAVRLLFPFSIESTFSLIPSVETVSPEIMVDPSPEIQTGVDLINRAVNPLITYSFSPDPVTSANPLQILIPVSAWIWVIGLTVMLLYTAISYWLLCRKVDTAIRYRNNIFQSEHVISPFVLGICKPKIYLPFQISDQDREYVIAHEQAHICRRDHWWKPLGFILLTLYWFNPVMWIAYIFLCRDIELACDEKVIRELSSADRADYTMALVACSVRRPMITACPLAFGEVGVKTRVKSVMNYRKPGFWIFLLAVISCMAVALCFLTNPKQDQFDIEIVIPAGNQAQYVYADVEISPTKNHIIISSDEQAEDTEVYLKTIQVRMEMAYEPISLKAGIPARIGAEKGGWFRIGVSGQNPTDADVVMRLTVENVEVRINNASISGKNTFRAQILSIQDGFFLVEPESGSREWNEWEILRIPMKNMDPSPEPEVGDVIEIDYDGKIEESTPAQINAVYHIRVVEGAETLESEYFLLIGREGVTEINVDTPNTSGGCQNADGSEFHPGEQVWLENLSGLTDLRGVSIVAMNRAGETLYEFSVPQEATDEEIMHLISSDAWFLAPTGTSFTAPNELWNDGIAFSNLHPNE